MLKHLYIKKYRYEMLLGRLYSLNHCVVALLAHFHHIGFQFSAKYLKSGNSLVMVMM
jgi:hypothetical protein